jgi:hypothetical protein
MCVRVYWTVCPMSSSHFGTAEQPYKGKVQGGRGVARTVPFYAAVRNLADLCNESSAVFLFSDGAIWSNNARAWLC